jgi:hypothetical protein
LLFAPFFSVLAAIGIIRFAGIISKKLEKFIITYILCSFGFVSLTQSLLINVYGPSALKSFLNSFTQAFGTNPNILTIQISKDSYLSSIPNIFNFILMINIIILGIPIILKIITLIKEKK